MTDGSASREPVLMTGAASIIASLEALGVDVIFGLPGGAILPTYDPLYDATGLRHILVRHEQGAGHAASGYAHATGRVGVVLVTSGPGATNVVTAMADANMDSVPMLVITGQVAASMMGTDAFQEADIVGATMPISKHSFLITKAEEIPATIAAAYHIAGTGRPGPVLVDITKSAQNAEIYFTWPQRLELPGYHPVTQPHSNRIREAADLIASSKRPVILAGGGVVISDAATELRQLAELSGLPVATTLMARDAFPSDHRQDLGMPGMHGTVGAVAALQRADLIVAIGTRFDDRVTGHLPSFAPGAKIIHADIDPAEIGKNRIVEVPIVGDAKAVLTELTAALPGAYDRIGRPDLAHWWGQIDRWRTTYPLGYQAPTDGRLAPQYVIERIAALTPAGSIFASGVGQHQMWNSQFLRFSGPRTWINSGGLGTMGYGLPAAMGAKVGRPEATVWCIDGDGCFQMTNQELATCALEGIPIKVAVINNSSLGMVRQWQTLFYGGRYSQTDLHTGPDTEMIPDFVKLADAYGCVGLRCDSADDVDQTIAQALAVTDRPVVIDFQVSRDAQVWPMVPAGVSNDDILYARGLTPDWDKE